MNANPQLNPSEFTPHARPGAASSRACSVLLALLLLCLAPAAAHAQEALWKMYVEGAERARQEMDYPEAEKRFKLALAKAKAFGETDHRVAETLAKLVEFNLGRKKMAEAEPYYKQALAIWEKNAGPDPAATAKAINSLALLYSFSGMNAEAEPLFKLGLAIRRKSLKPGDSGLLSDLLNSLSSLAQNFTNQGKHAEAEPYYREHAEVTANHPKLGAASISAALSFKNLAHNQDKLGKLAEAEAHFKRALDIAVKAKGADAPEAADYLNALSAFYSRQHRYTEADAGLRRVLAIRQKAVGAEHWSTIAATSDLAYVKRQMKDYDAAEPLLKQVRELRLKTAGPDHLNTAEACMKLAEFYAERGRHADAVPLFEQAVAIRQKSPEMGPRHEQVGFALYSLGLSQLWLNKSAEAEAALKRALEIAEEGRAPEADKAYIRSFLARAYFGQQRYAEAEASVKSALPVYEKEFGPAHWMTVDLLDDLARVFLARGEHAAAEGVYQKSVAAQSGAAAGEQPRLAYTLNQLGMAYLHQKKFEDALAAFRRAAEVGEKSPSPDVEQLHTSFTFASGVLYQQGKYAEAEPLARKAVTLREQALGPEHPELAKSLEEYALVLRKLKREAEADAAEARAKAIRAKGARM